jgi:HEAT repeat protein
MRRRQVAITSVSAIVLGISGALYFGCHSEPSSHGYSLGHLLATYVWIYQGHLTTPGWQDTRKYVREIGTNGLPQMLRWLAEDRPQWKVKAFDFHEKQLPSVLKTKPVHDWLSGEREDLHAKAGVCGFEILGPTAVPALPALERMALDSKHFARSARAINALKSIGHDAVPALVRIVLAPNSTNQLQAFNVLGSMGTNAAPAVPVLIELLKNKDVDIAGAALRTLDTLLLSGATVVPAIAEIVDHPKLHNLAISTIVDYQSEAGPAIPRLVQCLTNIDQDIAITAARALARLGWEADSVAPVLIGCLKTRDSRSRQAAILALNQSLLPDLWATSGQRENPSGLQQEWLAWQATKKVHGEFTEVPPVSFITKSLASSDSSARREAIIELGRRGRESPAAARALIDCLDDHPFEIAVGAALSLSESRLEPELVVPVLRGWLDVPDLRLPAIVCLAEYGERARAAEPALRKYLGGPEDKAIRAALEVIDSNDLERTVARPMNARY